tara:strand:+ start:1293 stop:2288 length:996 start_codon:yes stop_codon:yes gene_type:complete
VRAVVLVGGFGTRLQPLTLEMPKQMLPIVGRPMIEHVVGYLESYGITEVVLSMGFAPDVFQSAYPDGHCNGMPILYAIEPEPLDTAGAIRFAADFVNTQETFLVLNGDISTDLDIKNLISFHKESKAKATIHLTPVEDPSRYGVVTTDEEGRVLGFIEKPSLGEAPTNWINGGTYVFEPSVLQQIKPGKRVSVEKEIFPLLASEASLFAFTSEDYWIDMGTPSTYLQAQLDLIKGGVRSSTFEGIDPDAKLYGNVENSVIGKGVKVGMGSLIQRSILMDGAQVGEDVLVSDSIVGFGANVGRESVIESFSVIGHNAVVPPKTKLHALTLGG